MIKPSVSILMIEDNVEDVYLVRELISVQRFLDVSLKFVRTLQEGQEYLRDHTVDVVLLDLFLPDSSGIETFRAIKEDNEGVPVINFVHPGDTAVALKAVQEGAQDFLIKNRVDGQMFARSVLCAIEREKLRLKRSFESIFAQAHVTI